MQIYGNQNEANVHIKAEMQLFWFVTFPPIYLFLNFLKN